MVLFFTIVLYGSILGLASLLVLKHVELTTGKTLLTSVRPRMNGFFHTALFFVEYVLPALMVRAVRVLFSIVRTQAKVLLARSIAAFEHKLEHLLNVVREKTEAPRAGGQASAFLREVAEHKKTLLKRTKKDRTIVEE